MTQCVIVPTRALLVKCTVCKGFRQGITEIGLCFGLSMAENWLKLIKLKFQLKEKKLKTPHTRNKTTTKKKQPMFLMFEQLKHLVILQCIRSGGILVETDWNKSITFCESWSRLQH